MHFFKIPIYAVQHACHRNRFSFGLNPSTASCSANWLMKGAAVSIFVFSVSSQS